MKRFNKLVALVLFIVLICSFACACKKNDTKDSLSANHSTNEGNNEVDSEDDSNGDTDEDSSESSSGSSRRHSGSSDNAEEDNDGDIDGNIDGNIDESTDESDSTIESNQSSNIETQTTGSNGRATTSTSNANSNSNGNSNSNNNNSSTTTTAHTVATTTASSVITPTANGYNLSSLSCCDINGSSVSSSIFSSHRLTMINIWATYCGPCIEEMPELQTLNNSYSSSDFAVVGVVSDYFYTKTTTITTILSECNVSYLNLDSDALSGISIQYVPTTIFVNSEGKQVGEVYVGARSGSEWQDIVDSLLNQWGIIWENLN